MNTEYSKDGSHFLPLKFGLSGIKIKTVHHLKSVCTCNYEHLYMSLYTIYNNGTTIVTGNGEIVWKHRSNWSSYALMLRTKLY